MITKQYEKINIEILNRCKKTAKNLWWGGYILCRIYR